MKTFKVTENSATRGLLLQSNPYPHIGIGESGRGRKYCRFPVGKLFAEKLADIENRTLIEECSIIKTKKGTLLIVEPCRIGDWRALVHLSVDIGFRGGVSYEFPPEGVQVLAEGRIAQGDAGRMGGGPQYLVIMSPGATIKVHRSGRLYGSPANLLIHHDGDELRIGEADVVCPPTDETEGEEI